MCSLKSWMQVRILTLYLGSMIDDDHVKPVIHRNSNKYPRVFFWLYCYYLLPFFLSWSDQSRIRTTRKFWDIYMDLRRCWKRWSCEIHHDLPSPHLGLVVEGNCWPLPKKCPKISGIVIHQHIHQRIKDADFTMYSGHAKSSLHGRSANYALLDKEYKSPHTTAAELSKPLRQKDAKPGGNGCMFWRACLAGWLYRNIWFQSPRYFPGWSWMIWCNPCNPSMFEWLGGILSTCVLHDFISPMWLVKNQCSTMVVSGGQNRGAWKPMAHQTITNPPSSYQGTHYESIFRSIRMWSCAKKNLCYQHKQTQMIIICP